MNFNEYPALTSKSGRFFTRRNGFYAKTNHGYARLLHQVIYSKKDYEVATDSDIELIARSTLERLEQFSPSQIQALIHPRWSRVIYKNEESLYAGSLPSDELHIVEKKPLFKLFK